jgi:hypothetical protein
VNSWDALNYLAIPSNRAQKSTCGNSVEEEYHHMNTDPRRGLPSATERRRTNVRWGEDAEARPVHGEGGTPAGDQTAQDSHTGKPGRLHT